MSASSNSDDPPTYQQVLTVSQQELHKNNSLHYPPMPTAPMVQIIARKFPNHPVMMNCPFCGQLITTIVEEENGILVYALCICLIVFGLFIGCCLIPFCISDLKDKIHVCPRCHNEVGKMTVL